jgi:hypothetical protein
MCEKMPPLQERHRLCSAGLWSGYLVRTFIHVLGHAWHYDTDNGHTADVLVGPMIKRQGKASSRSCAVTTFVNSIFQLLCVVAEF